MTSAAAPVAAARSAGGGTQARPAHAGREAPRLGGDRVQHEHNNPTHLPEKKKRTKMQLQHDFTYGPRHTATNNLSVPTNAVSLCAALTTQHVPLCHRACLYRARRYFCLLSGEYVAQLPLNFLVAERREVDAVWDEPPRRSATSLQNRAQSYQCRK